MNQFCVHATILQYRLAAIFTSQLQGRSLGTVAHMTSLRRLRIGEYSITEAWTIAGLQEALLKSSKELQSNLG